MVLHDRRIRGSRANIDHIAIAPSGVWVIDTKRYRGKVAVVKPLFGRAKLTIAGRDKSRLVDGLAKQVALVEAAMDEVALRCSLPQDGYRPTDPAELPCARFIRRRPASCCSLPTIWPTSSFRLTRVFRTGEPAKIGAYS